MTLTLLKAVDSQGAPPHKHGVRLGKPTASLRSCEYSKNIKLCKVKIHYRPMILYLNYINRKTFYSIKEDQRCSNPKAHIG